MDEKNAKHNLLEIVKEYCQNFHVDKEFCEGDRVQYAGHVFDHNEIVSLVECTLGRWFAGGKYTEEFEKKMSSFLGIRYTTLVNSGSSANLLAFMALTSPLLQERAIQRGDEVITVAAGFPTTVVPILQYGAIPVFVDVTIPQYNIDVSMLEEALSARTKAVILAHTLGNPFDIEAVKSFCERNNLWLIEDNCDALGSKILIEGTMRYTGTIGDIGTSSFYPPHHITMGEGGAVYTNNQLLHKIMRSMRDWGRDCVCPPGNDNFCGHRFDKQFGDLPAGYDHKYVYSHFGYNLKATDLQAAIGCEQLKKLPCFIKQRQENFNTLSTKLQDLSESLLLPSAFENSEPSWFGFLITCRTNEERNRIVNHLETKKIQTRMLFAGNLVRHPCFSTLTMDQYRIIGNLSNTDTIMNNSFWIGVYPGMDDAKLDYMSRIIHSACT